MNKSIKPPKHCLFKVSMILFFFCHGEKSDAALLPWKEINQSSFSEFLNTWSFFTQAS